MQYFRFSAPGRTEIGGNHTDHQHGCVLAAAIDRDMTADVTLNDRNEIRIYSEGYDPFTISLTDLASHPDEVNTSVALVRGIAAAFVQRGAALQGFDAHICSRVLPGSGLSSSAAFEVLIGTILNELFFYRQMNAVDIARIGQWAENVYFGKPCGLMDQLACAVGGMIYVDFANATVPAVERIDFDFSRHGYDLCIIDTGADHARLTAEYAAITAELQSICAFFGKSVLRQIPRAQFTAALPDLRRCAGDRAILRALHVYAENERAAAQAAALKRCDLDEFLSLCRSSGRSSWMYLQNICPTGAVIHQDAALVLALCDDLLAGRGACRIHGGGFAGTVQAFVPHDILAAFSASIEQVLGAGSCHCLQLRPYGGIRTG